MITDDLHRLTGAYALHALSEEEREMFVRHLADCQACAEETAELSATAVRLGLAVSVQPDPEMRGRVLHRITAVRQETPGERPVPRAGRGAVRARLLSRWALAACLAAAGALGGAAVWQHRRAESARAQAHRVEQRTEQVSAVLAAPDARARAVTLSGTATGTVVVSHQRDQAVFVVSGMAQAPAGKVYQLWFDDGGTMRSAGLMDSGGGAQAVLLDGTVDGASGMGITVEPSGGSKQPTSAPIAMTRFPA
ncbi:anti-sigma factor [Streptomyces sp. NPDC048278]|uniref:anti-sigma factor n=1 Tax=Streptomyces sp. NPDC048278 TaxID=3155809 RepID=UPI00342ADCF3